MIIVKVRSITRVYYKGSIISSIVVKIVKYSSIGLIIVPSPT